VNDLMKYGSVQRGYMGIQFMDYKNATPEQLSQLGIDKNDGVYVNGVAPNSGAAKAGIAKGDFIVSINGIATHTGPELMEQVARYKPGDNISVSYVRSGKTYNTTIELKNIDGTTSIIKEESAARLLGASMRNLTSGERSKYGVDGGAVVTDLGDGPLAKQTRMHKGFVITSLNDAAINSVNDLQQSLAINQSNLQIGGFYPGSNGMYYYGLNSTGGTASSEQ
ncbi:MAG: PDZ domain-containing protein, partial [Flavipsychrobacter sp.]